MRYWVSILLVMIFCFFVAVLQVQAAWTITSRVKGVAGPYMIWEVGCTSDGNALSATSLDIARNLRGANLLALTVSPGTGGVVPNTTIDVTFTNEFGIEVWTNTAMSETGDTHHDLSDDLTYFPAIFGDLQLTVNDIGDSGDQVTLYLWAWKE